MRKFITVAASAVLASTTAMASAAAPTPSAAPNQATPAPPAVTAPAAKSAEPKVCKRLPQGKVCMTAKQWKDFEQLM